MIRLRYMEEINLRVFDILLKKWKYIVSREDYDYLALASFHHELYGICQFTGLEDKNGKKMYRGDVLRTDFIKENGLPVNIIISYEPATGFFGNMPDGANPEYSAVIIGNIYENPDLISSD